MEDKQIIWTFYLLVVMFAMISLFIFVRNSADDELFRQKVLALDLSFLEDAIISSPGDIKINYDLKGNYLEGFNIKTEKCNVFIQLEGDLIYDVNEKCFDDEFLERDSDIILSNPEKIKFKKENNKLIIFDKNE